MPIYVAVRSKAYFCGRFIAGIAGSNPAEGVDVCFFVIIIFRQVEVSATGWLLFQRNSVVCVRMCMCQILWSRNLNNEAT